MQLYYTVKCTVFKDQIPMFLIVFLYTLPVCLSCSLVYIFPAYLCCYHFVFEQVFAAIVAKKITTATKTIVAPGAVSA